MVLTFHSSDFFQLSHGAFPLHLLSLPEEGVSRCEGLASDVSIASDCFHAGAMRHSELLERLGCLPRIVTLNRLNHLQKHVKTICFCFDSTRDPEQ